MLFLSLFGGSKSLASLCVVLHTLIHLPSVPKETEISPNCNLSSPVLRFKQIRNKIVLLLSHGFQSIKHFKISMYQLCVPISPHLYPSKCVYILFTYVSQESSRPPRVHLVRPCVRVSSTLSSSCVCVIVKPFPSGELEDNLTNAPVSMSPTTPIFFWLSRKLCK